MNQQQTCSRKLVTFYHYIHSLQVHKNVLFQTGHLTPLQLFECFFDYDVIEFVVNSTNKYAAVDCNTDFRTNYDEIRKMFGIMFVTGYHTLPTIRSYWSQNPTLGCPIIKSTMTRDRFLRLKRFLHVCDNQTIDPKDKFAKASPLNNMLNKRFMQFGVFSHHLSIDEHDCILRSPFVQNVHQGQTNSIRLQILVSLLIRWILISIHSICWSM